MYDSDTSTVTAALQHSNPTVFSDATIKNILALTTKDNAQVHFETATPDVNGNVTVAAGAEVVYIGSSDTQQTTVKAPANAPVVIFQGKGGVDATINDGQATVPASAAGVVDRIVVGSAGNDKIVVADAKNTQITLGSGDSTVVTGGGDDTVIAGTGNSTIAGGTGGHAIVKMAGSATDYAVTVKDGHAVVTNATTHKTTDITKIQFVQLNDGNALIFAKDSTEAAVATLYHTTFGRDADAGGLKAWLDLAKAGATTGQIADAFTHSAEYTNLASTSDQNFVNSLYQNTFARNGEAAGLAYWTDALAHGTTRADLISMFANIASQSIAHTTEHQETTVVGSVTIVQDIV